MKMTQFQKATILSAVGIGLMALAAIYLMNIDLIDRKAKQPAVLLEPGWQFYDKPTSLESPGTVFRIDGAGRRFVVDVIEIPVITGTEVFGRSEQAIRSSTRVLSRFIGKDLDASASQAGARLETLEFEMIDVQREITTDVGIAEVLKAFPTRVEYRRDNRYFIIREARSAKELHYMLSEELVNGLGGSVSLSEFVGMKTSFSYGRRGKYVLSQELPARMRVMFLAEEIVVVSASLSGGMPEFDTIPITEPLAWE